MVLFNHHEDLEKYVYVYIYTYRLMAEPNKDLIWAKYVVTESFLTAIAADRSLERLGISVNGDIDLEAVRLIFNQSDPSPSTNKKYLSWIIQGYIDGGNHLLEDVKTQMNRSLIKFIKLIKTKKLSVWESNLLNYCGLYGCVRQGKQKQGLLDTLDKYQSAESVKQSLSSDADLIYEDRVITVYHPKTMAASQLYGKGTRWCTAGKSIEHNLFDQYNREGPLYIVVPRVPIRKQEKYQIHFPSFSFMNELDQPIGETDFLRYKQSLELFTRIVNPKITMDKIYRHISDHQEEAGSTYLPELIISNTDIHHPLLLIIGVVVRNPVLIQKLLELGHDPNLTNDQGYTPLHITDQAEVAELLLKHGANPNAQDRQGQTPLHFAYQPEVARLLLKHGADPNLKDKQGQIPLHLATNPEVVELLLRSGGNPNLIDNQGHTPLHLLSDPELIELLIQLGADPQIRDHLGRTPLHDQTNPQMVEFWLSMQIDPNTKDHLGYTPLHLLIIAQHKYLSRSDQVEDSINILLAHGADPNAKDQQGQTPLHLTYMTKFPNTINILIDHGANLDQEDHQGQTLLSLLIGRLMMEPHNIYPIMDAMKVVLSHQINNWVIRQKSLDIIKINQLFKQFELKLMISPAVDNYRLRYLR